MTADTSEILKKYWGYDSFRPLQADIINSVLSGHDTLALMPTGGGKSLCFQVPGLAQDGICIVISPLIALMQDQVSSLQKLGIKAIALHSAMSYREMDIALDNCVYGDIKFLYISPERLLTELFISRFKKMKLNLIAVDEAHCISQWGYDFRPPYLEIAKIREFHPLIPVIALTATATVEVIDDIQEKLKFKKNNVLSKSFARENLAYLALKEENKRNRLLKIASKINGCGIVYVRNRKKTEEIANFLNRNNVSALAYHAGLIGPVRQSRQSAWFNDEKRIIVATNAFGMGIDKPDVRFVVHLDLPQDLESYYQEAGRAGRDGNSAFAVLLWEPKDTYDLQTRLVQKFPEPAEIRSAYRALTNYLQLAIGSGENASFAIDINLIGNNFNLTPNLLYSSFKILETEGYLAFSEAFYNPSRIQFLVDKHALYDFQIRNSALDGLIQLLLRSYSGLFDGFVKINERDLAKRNKTTVEKTSEQLKFLHNHSIIEYVEGSDKPMVTFTQPCQSPDKLRLSKENYLKRKALAASKMESVIQYLAKDICRQRILLNYFGEKKTENCGKCDVCLESKKKNRLNIELESEILKTLENEDLLPDEIINRLSEHPKELIIKKVKWMIEEEVIKYNDNRTLTRKIR